MTATMLRGLQEPRIYAYPDYVSSAGEEAIELAAMAGLELDDWQQFVLVHALGELANGKWAASAVGVVVPRQNGKGGIIEARQLAGLYLLGEPLQIYSAHLFDTSLEAFRRLANLIEGSDELTRRVKRISRAHGEEGIELYGPKGRRTSGGQRIRFRTRTKGGGRGFSGECVYFDECMIFPEVSHAAILPILSAQKNPQAWYLGSAVDQTIHEDGIVFAGIRERGLEGADDERLAYFEHSADFDTPDDVTEEDAADIENWMAANPALGIRITEEAIRDEMNSLGARSFAVERLGVGDWPETNDDGEVISLEQWDALADARSKIVDPVCFAFDVTPNRAWATISAAGRNSDDLFHIETVDRRQGVRWLVDRLVELSDKHEPEAIVCAGGSAAESLVAELSNRGIEVIVAAPKDQTNACGQIFDLVTEERLRHLGSPELRAAIRGAKQRLLEAAWAWSRKSSAVDITPLWAATLALWASASASTTDPWATSW